tara:strand:- start:2512 stop:2751 length:240 start_codon:yes stop_codon:yes gene_type:complete
MRKAYWHQIIIIELRTERGLTQSDLAELCDVSVNTIGKIESGVTIGNFDTIDRIFNALGHEIEIIRIDDGEKASCKRFH